MTLAGIALHSQKLRALSHGQHQARKGTRGGAPRFVCMNDAPKVSPTDLAEDRTILASERTFAGWTRTSLGCIALGLGFHALFSTMEPEWAPRVVATGFLLLACLIVWLAERRAAAVIRRLNAHVVVTARKMNLFVIAACVSLGAAGLAIAIWFLPMR